MRIDLLSASAHKIGGLKGVGLLYVREGTALKPMIIGGGQEKGMRAGTENVPGIVGFATAAEITQKISKDNIIKLRDYFMTQLESIGGKINGSRERRIYNNVHVSFSDMNAEELVLRLSQKGIMCSTKSACSEKERDAYRILDSIKLSKVEKTGSLRFALGEKTSKKDIDYVIGEVKNIRNLKVLSKVY